MQFGLSGIPAQNVRWAAPIPDDPVIQSNLAGTVAATATMRGEVGRNGIALVHAPCEPVTSAAR